MNADVWVEVERLFHDAMQLDPERRRAFVASIESAEVREEVASLLATGGDRETSTSAR